MSDRDFFEKAYIEYEKGNFNKAFDLFELGANSGDTDCMTQLANMYTCGEGVPCDYEQAIRWELKAIEHGNSSAMLNLAITYRIKGDLKRSRHWFEKALELGDEEAALHLAKLYMVSDKELDTVINYLNIAIGSRKISEDSINEAKHLLKDLRR